MLSSKSAQISQLIKVSCLALASLTAVEAAISVEDLADFPDFAQAMADCGNGHEW